MVTVVVEVPVTLVYETAADVLDRLFMVQPQPCAAVEFMAITPEDAVPPVPTFKVNP